MTDASEHAPFPHMPGEGSRLASREQVLRGNSSPPAYLTIALRALDLGVLPSAAPPKTWLAEFDSAPDSREALRDIAQDFGLRSSSYADGSVAQWTDTKTEEALSNAEALKKLWKGYAGRLVAELDERQISPRHELERLNSEWVAFRRDRQALEQRFAAAALAREEALNRDFAQQAYWPGPSVIYWMYVREPKHFDEKDGMIIAYLESELAVKHPSLSQVTELFVTNATEALWQECRAGRVRIYGRMNGAGVLSEIPSIELQTEGVWLGEDMEQRLRVRTRADLFWSNVTFPREDVLKAFPPIDAAGDIPRLGDQTFDGNLDLVDRAKEWGRPKDQPEISQGSDAVMHEMMKAARAYVDANEGTVYLTDIYQAIADAPGLKMPGSKRKPQIADLLRKKYGDRIHRHGARTRATSCPD